MSRGIILWIEGLLVSLVLGDLITRNLVFYLRNRYEITKRCSRPTKLLGYLERFTFTLSFIIGYPTFIILWLGLKMAGKWSPKGIAIEKVGDDKAPAAINIFLIGNLVSLLFVTLGVYIIRGFKW